jgi:hypothetical protein
LYVVRLFPFISLRYWGPGYFGTGISKGSQFRYQDSSARAPEDPCTSACIFVGCAMVTTDEGLTTPFAPCLAIPVPAARIAEAPGARSSVGRAPPSHGGGQGFESPRVHSFFSLDLQVKRRKQKRVPCKHRDPLLQPYCNPLTQHVFEGAGGTVLHVGEHVRVGIKSYGDRSVS